MAHHAWNHAIPFTIRAFGMIAIAAVLVLAMTVEAIATTPTASPVTGQPEHLSSLQDQCIVRSELKPATAETFFEISPAQRMRAICVGFAVLAVEDKSMRASKAAALRDACLREARFGAEAQIREHVANGEALCQALYSTVAN